MLGLCAGKCPTLGALTAPPLMVVVVGTAANDWHVSLEHFCLDTQ